MTTRAPDALVVGGGPAGCAAASFLAQWGHAVSLVSRPSSSAALGESIPPSTGRLFDLLGVRQAVDRAGFVRSSGNTVWWGSNPPRVELFAGGATGWQVTRDALQRLLVEHARFCGACIIESRQTPETAAGRAAFTLDCTGRAGLLARSRGLRVSEPRFRTVAIVGLWRGDRPFAVPDNTQTLIESYDGGWAWSVPRSANERFVALMVDPRTSDLARGTPSSEVYSRQLRRAARIRNAVANAVLVEGPSGWDASMYHADRYVDGDVLLVGDAGSFIDPLSSAGIKKALASGWLAAVAVHTALRRPGMRQTALDFYAAREADVYASFLSMTEQFFAEAAAGHAHPFWSDRADQQGRSDADETVHAAFERLRAEQVLRVRRNSGVQVEQRPAVVGNEIVFEDRIVSAPADPGTRFAFGVDVLALADLASAYSSVPDLFEAYNRRQAAVALPDFLAALATALARNWLVWL